MKNNVGDDDDDHEDVSDDDDIIEDNNNKVNDGVTGMIMLSEMVLTVKTIIFRAATACRALASYQAHTQAPLVFITHPQDERSSYFHHRSSILLQCGQFCALHSNYTI